MLCTAWTCATGMKLSTWAGKRKFLHLKLETYRELQIVARPDCCNTGILRATHKHPQSPVQWGTHRSLIQVNVTNLQALFQESRAVVAQAAVSTAKGCVTACQCVPFVSMGNVAHTSTVHIRFLLFVKHEGRVFVENIWKLCIHAWCYILSSSFLHLHHAIDWIHVH